jgi:hypothetical protein
MSEQHTLDTGPSLLTTLRRILRFDERRQFILLFLMINLLIFILIWLSWQNQVLVREVTVLETRVVAGELRVVECEVDCTDKMSTMAVKQAGEIAQMTATIGVFITRSPISRTPADTSAWTTVPPSTLTFTPTLMPPTPPHIPTLTPTLLPSFTPSAVPSSPPPVDAPTPTPTTTPTPTATATHIPPPTVLSIMPNQGVNSAPVPVVIRGSNFFGTPTVKLGASVSITISAATADMLTGTVPAGITPGVYALRVENPDGQLNILSPAYTAFGPDTTLETSDLVTFDKAAASLGSGGKDQVRVIFPESLDAVTHMLHVRTFDPQVDPNRDGAYVDRDDGLPLRWFLGGPLLLERGWS